MPTVETICTQCDLRGVCQEPCDRWYDALQSEYLTPNGAKEE